jgi:hypothetical protein
MDFLRWTNWQITTPKPYGWFHLTSLVLTLVIALILGLKGKKDDNKAIDKTVLGIGIFLLIIETYKQFFFTYVLYDGSYPWYIFPFQFCSTPAYVCLIAPLIKNSKIKEACYSFLAFFGLLAGISVMFYPNDVFISSLSICIHTMLWHGAMVVVGVYLIVAKNYGLKIREVLRGSLVYLSFISIALLINIISYNYLQSIISDGLNLFYISPYGTCHLPILSTIQTNYGWVALILCYLLAFYLGVIFIYLITKEIKYIVSKIGSSRLAIKYSKI